VSQAALRPDPSRQAGIRHLAGEHGFSVLIKDDPRGAPGTAGVTGQAAAGA
jgi:hypothetical protein